MSSAISISNSKSFDLWIENLNFDDILSLLNYSVSNTSNIEKQHIHKTLLHLLHNLSIIKEYYNQNTQITQNTQNTQITDNNCNTLHKSLFDVSPITIESRTKPKQKRKYQSITSDITSDISSINIDRNYNNCGRSQCEMRFNGCPHYN